MRILSTKQQRDEERAFESAVQYVCSEWSKSAMGFNQYVNEAAKIYKVDAKAVANEVVKRSNSDKKE